MFALLWSQWRHDRRSPYLTLLFIGLSIIAVMLFALNTESKLEVAVFPGPGVTDAEASLWMEKLREGEAFDFVTEAEQKARAEVSGGRAIAAVQLLPDDYRIIAAVEDYQIQLVEKYVDTVFQRELSLRAAAAREKDPEQYREAVEQAVEQPPLTLQVTSVGSGGLVSYDMGLQLVFAFTLFLVMFTIGFKINTINTEKISGIWNRMILSPASKTQIYSGHLVYASVIGLLQIAIVYLIFLFVFDFPLGERLGLLLAVGAVYTVAIVAIAMLFTGITRTPEQFHMVYPMITPIMPIISGAYMPPGTITNSILLWMAELLPITHAMKASIGITLHDYGWSELYMPLVKLLLIAVLCMGVGMNLVERGRR